jgi:hypothetical protein
MQGAIVKVVEELASDPGETEVKLRLVTVRVDKPWPGNIYESFQIRDEAKRFEFGDKVEIEVRKVE